MISEFQLKPVTWGSMKSNEEGIKNKNSKESSQENHLIGDR